MHFQDLGHLYHHILVTSHRELKWRGSSVVIFSMDIKERTGRQKHSMQRSMLGCFEATCICVLQHVDDDGALSQANCSSFIATELKNDRKLDITDVKLLLSVSAEEIAPIITKTLSFIIPCFREGMCEKRCAAPGQPQALTGFFFFFFFFFLTRARPARLVLRRTLKLPVIVPNLRQKQNKTKKH